MCQGSATRLLEINGLFKALTMCNSEKEHKELREIIYTESKHLLVAANPSFVHRVQYCFRRGRPMEARDVTELTTAQKKGCDSALAIAPPNYKDLLVIYDSNLYGVSRYFLDACHDPKAYATALSSYRAERDKAHQHRKTASLQEPAKFVEPRFAHLLVENAEFRVKYCAFGNKISVDYPHASIFQDPPTYKMSGTGAKLAAIEQDCFAALRAAKQQYIASLTTTKPRV